MADHHSNDQVQAKGSSVESFTGAELPFRNLYLAGILIAVVSIGYALVIFPLNDVLVASVDREYEGDIVPDRTRATGARLQQGPEADWKVFENLMAERLATYGWQDRATGIVRIPVDRAVELALVEHLIASTDNAKPAKLVLPVAGSHSSSNDSHADVPSPTSHEEVSH